MMPPTLAATTGEAEATASRWRLPAELCVVVPTFRERENLRELLTRIDRALTGVAYEVVFVDDDSPDGTAALARQIARQDPRIRCIRRVGRRGLSGACIEGALSCSAPVVAVMDADLQHDETLLPRMLEAIQGGADLVIGSRYLEQGSADEGFGRVRASGSRLATLYSRHILNLPVTDPLSGFFMVRRDVFEDSAPQMTTEGFKLLLDLLGSRRPDMRIVELPYAFRARHAGESKMDAGIAIQFAALVLAKATRNLLPPRFILFGAVGTLGIAVHLAALQALFEGFRLPFVAAQLGATLIAMTGNFALNNAITYRDRKLKGLAFWRGLLSFYAVCSFGTLANVSVASVAFGAHPEPLPAGLAGAVMSAVFNYAATRALTWRA